nr:immunoglobulin heavy chain junction region [Macaca mulatta]MOX59891.1 immunoglobulin heavy chain junction region [Macaca mulatta]MOX60340.1 immunoglobulin heavy chain junction region [Macaca mulatta]MOX61314.1 immunoglobulin heavy chain junction region [Macaca mulatta]MOX64837.1 immunoglobulin heavy chain junction region [Macaca mulatta]
CARDEGDVSGYRFGYW